MRQLATLGGDSPLHSTHALVEARDRKVRGKSEKACQQHNVKSCEAAL